MNTKRVKERMGTGLRKFKETPPSKTLTGQDHPEHSSSGSQSEERGGEATRNA